MNLKVMYVEDDTYAREELMYYLKKIGIKVISAEDGIEGLTKWELHKPDIIIVDLLMPNMDGISFIRELKAKNCESRIIVATSVDSLESVLEVVNLGIDYYIVKPLDFAELELKLNCLADTIAMKQNISSFGFGSLENRRSIEDAIKTDFIKLLKNYTGKGPRETVVQLHGNKATITCFDPLTIMEQHLLKNNKNFELVKQTRNVMYDELSAQIAALINEKTNIIVTYEKTSIQLKKRIEQIIFTIM